MKIIEIDVNNIELKENRINLVLGYFDGVHIGHQQMINKAIEEGETGIMTFDISPSFVLGKSIKYSHITSLFDKANIFKHMGVKYLYILRVSKPLLNLSKDEFMDKILAKINPKKIFIGKDYHFGKDGAGDAIYLAKRFNVHVEELLERSDTKVSSRAIRELISLGEMEEVNKLLGRPYQVTGLVVEGFHNGEKIGFPTANLELSYPYVLPKIGVYIGYAKILNSRYKAIISMSTHPTIQELNDPIIEVHLINFKDNLYGKEIEVQLVRYIRDIKKYDFIKELKAQLTRDCELAKNELK